MLVKILLNPFKCIVEFTRIYEKLQELETEGTEHQRVYVNYMMLRILRVEGTRDGGGL